VAQALEQNVGTLDWVLSFLERPLAELSWLQYHSPAFHILFALAKTPHPPMTNVTLIYPIFKVFIFCKNSAQKARWKGGHRTGKIIQMTSMEDRWQQPGTGCPEKLWLSPAWQCSRPGWMGFWATCSSGRCPCPW